MSERVANRLEVPWKPNAAQQTSLSASERRWRRRWGEVRVMRRRRDDEEVQTSRCEKRSDELWKSRKRGNGGSEGMSVDTSPALFM